ncbi:large ribosomal subunit protein uL15m-like [Haliotis asinina]|uniref:large ribosomal subunit protein uL15m-like n=1 Tax=Haliotis asinina TaxID=109174 RepID=UPI003531C50E
MASIEKALNLIKQLPRVSLGNIRDLPGSRKPKQKQRSGTTRRKHGRGNKGQGQRNTLPRLGFEGGNTPFYLIIPKEPYYKGHAERRQYPPLSLLQLQRMIDMGRVDPEQPVDLATICNTRLYRIEPVKKHFGINLTEEGADIFAARINIEVQWASELVIAAIERNGGVITTRYFDPQCLHALANPLKFFQKSVPIPRCKLPPEDALEYYTSAKSRGYLADPEQVKQARLELAQKYGYELPDVSSDPLFDMLSLRKDPRQIFHGLEPGWVVNLKHKQILKPKDEEYEAFYKS